MPLELDKTIIRNYISSVLYKNKKFFILPFTVKCCISTICRESIMKALRLGGKTPKGYCET